MKKFKRNFRVLPVVVALCLIVAGGAATFAQRHFAINRHAAGRPEVKVILAGLVRRESKEIPVEKVSAVNPGEILNWTITSQNDGTAPAHEYKTVSQIPEGTSFVAGSAGSDETVAVGYSIDGGKNYSEQPLIEEKQADGSVKRVPAPVAMYTQIRYEWNDPLAADGGKFSASYKVRVK